MRECPATAGPHPTADSPVRDAPEPDATLVRDAPVLDVPVLDAPVLDAPVLDLPVPPLGTMGPPAEYEQLRRECPVAKVRLPFGATAWYVTRYDDVRQLIADPRLIRPTINDWPARPDANDDAGAAEPGLVTMMELDGPQHLALRRALAEPFSVRAIRRQVPVMRRAADELLDTFAAGGRPGDLVAGYLEPYPLRVMCDLVGIPYEDSEHFLPMADAALGAMLTLEEGRKVTRQLREYIGSLIDRKRRTPGDDMLTGLVRQCDAGVVDQESVVNFGLSMLVAGYRTSTMFLADAVVALLTEPGHYARLRDNRDLLPRAVEELVRYVPVMNGVVVLQAVEDFELHGQTIRAGDAVLPVLAAANRDGTVFPDADRLDLCRSDNPHLMFGRGAHNCIGSHLARAQMTVGLEALFDHFPNLTPADGHPAVWDDESPSKSPLTLPVTWS
ncbi:putative cytochrome P450 [Streptomyces sp. NBRC 110611]|uniref:cytochrome P450 n=1 Tax=Streptomyces sp. NBRC 110611 TaxID=1621259 RepID=UPI000857FC33|nr:cytochrome P450 [Streptomyces sp. NBRC 110611]GAU69403.1 putative cytochrome P450 [Streptomyces sp. NBRC 110611]